jgi:hypothetical protein
MDIDANLEKEIMKSEFTDEKQDYLDLMDKLEQKYRKNLKEDQEKTEKQLMDEYEKGENQDDPEIQLSFLAAAYEDLGSWYVSRRNTRDAAIAYMNSLRIAPYNELLVLNFKYWGLDGTPSVDEIEKLLNKIVKK